MAKRHKVEEPAGTYSALPKGTPKQGAAGVRYARNEDVRKANEKLMKVHREVLEKLAK
jgi:hypothetical protein